MRYQSLTYCTNAADTAKTRAEYDLYKKDYKDKLARYMLSKKMDARVLTARLLHSVQNSATVQELNYPDALLNRVRTHLNNGLKDFLYEERTLVTVKMLMQEDRLLLKKYKKALGTMMKNAKYGSISAKNMDTRLSAFPGYKPGSFSMGKRVYPKLTKDLAPTPYKYIRFVLTGLKCTPSRNYFAWLNEGRDVMIPLDDIEVICNLDTTKVYVFAAKRKHSYSFHRPGHSGEYIHPHIMDDYSPCLGHFQAGVQTALTDMDIIMLFLNLKAYFEQANDDDSAGKRWRNWVTEVLIPQLKVDIVSYDNKHCKIYAPEDDVDNEYLEIKIAYDATTGTGKVIVPEIVKVNYAQYWP